MKTGGSPAKTKINLDDYEMLQTLGTGRELINLRIIWKSTSSQREERKQILRNEISKESRNS